MPQDKEKKQNMKKENNIPKALFGIKTTKEITDRSVNNNVVGSGTMHKAGEQSGAYALIEPQVVETVREEPTTWGKIQPLVGPILAGAATALTGGAAAPFAGMIAGGANTLTNAMSAKDGAKTKKGNKRFITSLTPVRTNKTHSEGGKVELLPDGEGNVDKVEAQTNEWKGLLSDGSGFILNAHQKQMLDSGQDIESVLATIPTTDQAKKAIGGVYNPPDEPPSGSNIYLQAMAEAGLIDGQAYTPVYDNTDHSYLKNIGSKGVDPIPNPIKSTTPQLRSESNLEITPFSRSMTPQPGNNNISNILNPEALVEASVIRAGDNSARRPVPITNQNLSFSGDQYETETPGKFGFDQKNVDRILESFDLNATDLINSQVEEQLRDADKTQRKFDRKQNRSERIAKWKNKYGDYKSSVTPGENADENYMLEGFLEDTKKAANAQTLANVATGIFSAVDNEILNNKIQKKDFVDEIAPRAFTPTRFQKHDIVTPAQEASEKSFNTGLRALTESGNTDRVSSLVEAQNANMATARQQQVQADVQTNNLEAQVNSRDQLATKQMNAQIEAQNQQANMQEDIIKSQADTNTANARQAALGRMLERGPQDEMILNALKYLALDNEGILRDKDNSVGNTNETPDKTNADPNKTFKQNGTVMERYEERVSDPYFGAGLSEEAKRLRGLYSTSNNPPALQEVSTAENTVQSNVNGLNPLPDIPEEEYVNERIPGQIEPKLNKVKSIQPPTELFGGAKPIPTDAPLTKRPLSEISPEEEKTASKMKPGPYKVGTGTQQNMGDLSLVQIPDTKPTSKKVKAFRSGEAVELEGPEIVAQRPTNVYQATNYPGANQMNTQNVPVQPGTNTVPIDPATQRPITEAPTTAKAIVEKPVVNKEEIAAKRKAEFEADKAAGKKDANGFHLFTNDLTQAEIDKHLIKRGSTYTKNGKTYMHDYDTGSTAKSSIVDVTKKGFDGIEYDETNNSKIFDAEGNRDYGEQQGGPSLPENNDPELKISFQKQPVGTPNESQKEYNENIKEFRNKNPEYSDVPDPFVGYPKAYRELKKILPNDATDDNVENELRAIFYDIATDKATGDTTLMGNGDFSRKLKHDGKFVTDEMIIEYVKKFYGDKYPNKPIAKK